MIVSQEKLSEINSVQTRIYSEIMKVCDKLSITCFMVHGSLLGTVKKSGFMPFDDDIDVALFRNDYELFLKEAPCLLPDNLFVQTPESDSEYPLEFAKVRDSKTTYIIERVRNLNINHGIYVDVFPIDFYNHKTLIENLFSKMRAIRITCAFKGVKTTFPAKVKRAISCIFYPSRKRAIKIRDKKNLMEKESALLKLSGGKTAEQGIPAEWFSDKVEFAFEGLKAFAPVKYNEYLTKIYGDYMNHILCSDDIVDDSHSNINACIVDINKPFTEYII